jgi:hypothetical protein
MTRKLKPHEYKCQTCKGIFNKGWSDEEALAEFRGYFPDLPMEEAGVICDICYQKMIQDMKDNPAKYEGLPDVRRLF